MKLCLEYMYGNLQGELDDHDCVAALFRVADKYDISGLVGECVQVFNDITTKHDIPQLLLLSEEHRQPELREVCVHVSLRHINDYMVTPGFKDLL